MNTKLIGLVSLAAIFCGVACSAPPATGGTATSKTASTLKNTHAFHAPASAETKAAFGITTWHMMTQPDAHAVVIDGADAKGVVRFSTVIRQDAKDKGLHIESYKKHAGEFSLAKQANGDYLISNTIDMKSWLKVSDAFSADWKKQPAVQEYGYYGDKLAQAANIADGVSKVTGVLGRIAGWIPLPQAQAASRVLNATSAVAGKVADVLDKASKVVGAVEDVLDKRAEDAKKAEEANKEETKPEETKPDDTKPEDTKPEDTKPEETKPEDTPVASANPDGTANTDTASAAAANGDATANADTANTDTASALSPNATGANDAVASAEGQGDTVSADTIDNNLDNSNTAEQGNAEQGNAEQGNAEQGNAEQGNAEQGNAEQGNAEQGNAEQGNAEQGGGSTEPSAEYATHKKCRALSCSKKTKACICKKY